VKAHTTKREYVVMKFLECECCGFLAAIPEKDSEDLVCPFCVKSSCPNGKFEVIPFEDFLENITND